LHWSVFQRMGEDLGSVNSIVRSSGMYVLRTSDKNTLKQTSVSIMHAAAVRYGGTTTKRDLITNLSHQRFCPFSSANNAQNLVRFCMCMPSKSAICQVPARTDRDSALALFAPAWIC